MGKSAPFGRPGARDRLRLWWQGTDKTFRMNALLFLVVGTISASLVWAGVSRDATPTRGRATAAGNRISVPSSLSTVPASLGLRTAGADQPPSEAPGTTTSTTTAAVVSPPTTVSASSSPRATAAAPTPAPNTTVRTSEVTFTEVPAPAPDPPVPPAPASTVPTTTAPPATTPTSTAPPPTSAPPTTSVTLLPPLSVPRLLGPSRQPGSGL